MIYVKLAAPIILTAQIPEIAEILDVEKEFLWKLVSFSTYAYAEKNGKRSIIALPNPAADFTEAVAKYDKVYYGAEAALKMSPDTRRPARRKAPAGTVSGGYNSGTHCCNRPQ